MNISIIGMGYVGLTLGVALARVGITVHGVESNRQILDKLQSGKAHFYEPGIDGYLQELNNEKIFFHSVLPSDVNFFAHIISVGTPLNAEKEPDFDHLMNALKAIEPCVGGDELIVLRSTVSVGTTRNLVVPWLSEITGKDVSSLRVAFCPERTIEGSALDELEKLPQIISGLNSESEDLAEQLFLPLTQNIVKVESLEAGELVKLFNNTYRDMHFSLGNCFSMVAQDFGVDGFKVIEAANFHYPRSHIPKPGFVGGPCLEKDAYILVNSYGKKNGNNCEIDFILGARRYNESIVDSVIEWVDKESSFKDDGVVVISGLAFKGVPETSDLRGSLGVMLGKKLFQKGYKLRLHDFRVAYRDLQDLDMGEVYTNIYDACDEAGVILLLNNHIGYAKLDCELIGSKMRADGIVFDAWGAIDERQRYHVKHYHLGNYKK
jgi:UDP-N-acetyl-D-mannosaminuronic acid dehydrogenase